MPDIAGSMQTAGALSDALQDLLRQIIDKIIGGPSKGKGGEPLQDVVYMVKPLGFPINPRCPKVTLGGLGDSPQTTIAPIRIHKELPCLAYQNW